MKEFKVNDQIILKLEGNETVIYVAGERFNQCKFLLLTSPFDDINAFNEIESIDMVAEMLDWKKQEKEKNKLKYQITPETEFWDIVQTCKRGQRMITIRDYCTERLRFHC